MRNRVALLGAAAIVIAAACSDSSGPGGASNVALLVNDNFVVYDTSVSDAEASEMEFTLVDLGVTVTQVTDVDSASLAASLANSQALVIPENGGAFTFIDSLSSGALSLIKNFVETRGGILIVIPDASSIALLDSLWGYTIGGGNTTGLYPLDPAEAGGTAFAGGPAQVFENDGVYMTADSTYPAAARLVYRDGAEVAVAVIPQGAGAVVVLAWDWFDAVPHGGQNGNWPEILRRALRS